MARIAIMALEGLEEVVDAPVDAPMEDTSVEEIAEQPENEIIEMDSISDEMEDHSDSMEEAADTAETLTDIHDQMGESLETGGLDETAAAAIEVAVEHMLARVGFPPKRTGFALEAFKSKASRVHATKVAMESIAERAKQIWATIVASFKKAVEWIKGFFAQLMDGALKMEKRSEDIIKAAQAKKGKTPTADARIKGSNLVKYLRNKDKIVQGEELIKQYGALSQEAVANHLEFAAVGIVAYIDSLFDKVMKADEFNELVKTNTDGGHNLSKAMTGGVSKEVDGMSVYEYSLALSDMAMISTHIRENASIEEIYANISKTKVVIDKKTGYKDIDSSSEFIALTPDEVVKLATLTQGHMKTYAATKKASDDLSKAANDITTKAAKYMANVKDVADQKQISFLQTFAMKCISLTTNIVSKSRSLDINITKAALDYCASSLKKTGEGDAPAQIENKKTEEKAAA